MFLWKEEEPVMSCDWSFVIQNVKARKLCHCVYCKCFDSFYSVFFFISFHVVSSKTTLLTSHSHWLGQDLGTLANAQISHCFCCLWILLIFFPVCFTVGSIWPAHLSPSFGFWVLLGDKGNRSSMSHSEAPGDSAVSGSLQYRLLHWLKVKLPGGWEQLNTHP